MKDKKIIIPWIITLKTKEKNIKQLEICDDLDFFSYENRTEQVYKLDICKDLKQYQKISQLWNISFTEDGLVIYKIDKKLLKAFFCYDSINKRFICSKNYTYIPFQIWNIYPAGKIISDVIRYNLALDGFLTCLWAAVRHKNKNYVILWPSKSWKTTLMNILIDQWWEYIAEDMLVVNKKEGTIFPTSITSNQWRTSNKKLKNNLSWKSTLNDSFKIDTIIFLWEKKELRNYIYIYALNFLENTFVKAILYKKWDSSYFSGMMKEIEEFMLSYKVIYETNLEKIKNKLWK